MLNKALPKPVYLHLNQIFIEVNKFLDRYVTIEIHNNQ